MKFRRIFGVSLVLAGVTACSSNHSPAPVSEAGHRAGAKSRAVSAPPAEQPLGKNRYRVKAGDTLYAIAWMYGLDFQEVARYNGIQPPYGINTGQILKLDLDDPSAGRYVVKRGDSLLKVALTHGTTLSRLAARNNLKAPYVIHPGQLLHLEVQPSVSNGSMLANRDQTQNTDVKTASPTGQGVAAVSGKAYSRTVNEQIYNKSLTWSWPTKGRIVQGFSLSEQGNKGVDIAGTRGQAVLAAASGRVVYAGSALRGYGNLIIIKHDDDYLSAYAHNDVLRVKEQQEVKAGQRIADMGSSDAQDVRLHFEIRYRGQSVNPMRFLPQR